MKKTHKQKVSIARKMLADFRRKYRKIGVKPPKSIGLFNNPLWDKHREEVAGRVKNKEVGAAYLKNARKANKKV